MVSLRGRHGRGTARLRCQDGFEAILVSESCDNESLRCVATQKATSHKGWRNPGSGPGPQQDVYAENGGSARNSQEEGAMKSRKAAAESVRVRFINDDRRRPGHVVTHIAMFRDEYEAVKGQARIEALEEAKKLIDGKIRETTSECHKKRLKVADRWESFENRDSFARGLRWILFERQYSSWWYALIILGLLIAACFDR